MTMDLDERDILIKSAERIVEPGKWNRGTLFGSFSPSIEDMHSLSTTGIGQPVICSTTDVQTADQKDLSACAWGTLRLMAYRLGLPHMTSMDHSEVSPAFQAGMLVQQILNKDRQPGDAKLALTSWNDREAETAEQVAELFREAADLIE